jgi:outer membrane immunogenic protein
MIRRERQNGCVIQQTKTLNSGVVMTKKTTLASIGIGLALVSATPSLAAGQWTGIYLGGHAGGIWGDVDTTKVGESGIVDIDGFSNGSAFDFSPNGVLGGAQVGYLYQMSNIVLGIEVSGSMSDFDQSRLQGVDDVKTVSSDWNAAATLRAGWAFGNSLAYVKGGYAMADLEHRDDDNSGTNRGTYKSNENHSGWTAGAGFEQLISQDVSLALEYAYHDFGGEDHVAPFEGATIEHDIDMTLHTVTARLNWHFNP